MVLLGPPGSGKGTQAERLGRRLGVPAVSTGEMLRAAVATGTPLGERVADVMAAGRLVDDALMAEVVRERLSDADARRGFVLDGYPRTLPQASTLDEILTGQGRELDAVVLLAVPEEMLVQRTVGRQRADDREDIVRERLRVYRSTTEPLVAHYGRRGVLVEIDGGRPIGEVTSDILRALGVGAAAAPSRESETPQWC